MEEAKQLASQPHGAHDKKQNAGKALPSRQCSIDFGRHIGEVGIQFPSP